MVVLRARGFTFNPQASFESEPKKYEVIVEYNISPFSHIQKFVDSYNL